jgi:hypothetical protein
VTQLRPAGAGALGGLQIGDLLTHVVTKELADTAQFVNVLNHRPPRPRSYESWAKEFRS